MLDMLFPKKGIIMPLKDEGNKLLHCLRCGKPAKEISDYGWIHCDACEDYIRLSTIPINNNFDVKLLYDKHKDHDKPCCSAAYVLKEISNENR